MADKPIRPVAGHLASPIIPLTLEQVRDHVMTVNALVGIGDTKGAALCDEVERLREHVRLTTLHSECLHCGAVLLQDTTDKDAMPSTNR